jgi:homogentisate 1,2-dioxygenase
LLEELVGVEGFSGESSLLYHRRSPSALVRIEPIEDERPQLVPNQPIAPIHLVTAQLAKEGDPVLDRRLIAGNDDVRICVARSRESSELYRDAIGDELVFVQSGHATLQSSFGSLRVRPADYVVVPTGVAHRWVIDSAPLELLIIETSSHVRPPARYLTPRGQFLEQAPFCERDVRAPEVALVVDADGPADVIVRTRDGLARHTHANHPFDVVGWDGCLYPWALSIHDFEPIVGSLHQPPHVHQTFDGPNCVVCSFVPRPFDFHPEAVKIPYHHSNVDSDEVIFYSSGNFMSRAGSGVGVGSLTLHPPGFVHGPQPGSFERSVDATRTEEVAVMLDTFRPLLIAEDIRAHLDPAYLTSWNRGS